MSAYEKPEKDLAIFDPSVFTSNDEPLTINTGSKYFLRFPYAQNTENFVDMNVFGNAKIDGQITATADLSLNPTGNINASKRIIMTSTTAANRAINNSLLVFNENTGTYNSTPLLQIYSTGNSNYYESLLSDNTSSINFRLKNTGGSVINPLKLTPLSITSNVSLTANQGITVNNQPSVFNSGLNVYSNSVFDGIMNIASGQSIVINNGSTINFLASSILNMASSSIAQTGTVGNTLGSINMIANNGILFPTGSGVINQTVTNAVDTNSLKRTSININSGVAAGSNASCLDGTDQTALGDARGFVVYPNSGSGTLNGITQSGDTVFGSKNAASAGAFSNALTLTCFTSDRIGVRLNAKTLTAPTIELSTTSTNIITMDKDKTNFNQKSLFRAGLATSDVINHIAAGGTETTAMTISATQSRFDLPIAFANTSYPTARTAIQLGYINSGSIAGVNVATSTSVRNLGSASSIQVNSGVWRVDINYSFAPITTASSVTNLTLAINTVSTSIPTSGALMSSVFEPEVFTLAGGTYYSFTCSASVLNNNSGTLISIYPVYILEFTGATNFIIGCNWVVTRIG